MTREVEEIEATINQSLRAHDPKTDRSQAQHDRIVNRDSETNRDQVEQDRHRRWNDPEFRQGNADDYAANGRVNDAVETELFGRNGELAVHRQDEERVELSGADELGNVGHVDEKERLEKLGDHLMGADEQDHFPFCPITDAIDIAENDGEKNDLADEPKHFHQHPEKKVRFETHLADQRVAKHDGIDVDVTPEHGCLSF